MPKVDVKSAPVKTACAYPAPYDKACEGRSKIALGDLGGLDQFGVNLTRLAPGAASAQKHWHKNEDELIYLLEGEAVLVEDDGETILRAGDVATFKAGISVGHMLVNRSGADVVLLEVGTRAADEVATYTDLDVDMSVEKEKGGDWRVLHRDGRPY